MRNNRYTVYSILLIGIIILASITYIFWDNFDIAGSNQVTNYFEMLGALSVIIGVGSIALDYTNDIREKEETQQQNQIDETQESWIDLEKFFVANYPYLARLYQQMNTNNPTLKGLPPNLSKEDMFKVEAFEKHTCSIIFQMIENVYIFISSQSGSGEYCAWLRIWQIWFKSPILLQQWRYTKMAYNIETQRFIDLCVIKNCPKSKQLCNNETIYQ
jgi:hypothetical protein